MPPSVWATGVCRSYAACVFGARWRLLDVGSDRVACGYRAASDATVGRWLSSLVGSATGRDSSKML